MFHSRLYLSIVSSHFVVDMLTGVSGVLLAVLSGPLHLSNAQVAMAITLYTLIGAVSQPVFGWWTDTLPERWSRAGTFPLLMAAVGVIWMAAFFCAVALTSDWGIMLPFFLLAALGSGLYHPIGTSYAPAAQTDSANTATAVFFLGGQMGLAIGPVLGGLLFDAVGKLGILPLAVLAVAPAGMLGMAAWQARLPLHHHPEHTTSVSVIDRSLVLRRLFSQIVLAFVVLVALRSSAQTIYQYLLPKLFADRGWESSMYGLLAGLFMGTAAIGNVVIGRLADRFGARLVTSVSLLMSMPIGWLFLTTSSSVQIFVTCALAGLLIGGQHSVLVVYAQQLLPVRKGLAAGLILGFTFGTGALGTWLCGITADYFGLEQVMLAVTLLGLPSALLALTLPGQATPAEEVSELQVAR